MDLRDALSQIDQIRQQMAQTQTFRGYRAATTAFSGAVAFVAAGAQGYLLPQPLQTPIAYLAIWLSAALISVTAFTIELALRYRRTRVAVQRQLILLAAEALLPAIIAGGLLTITIVRFAPASFWMLPGLWGIIFSLGVFASRRLLANAVFWVGAFYLLAGVSCLIFAQDEAALSPWTMGLMFGVGQLLAAIILYWNLERPHGHKSE